MFKIFKECNEDQLFDLSMFVLPIVFMIMLWYGGQLSSVRYEKCVHGFIAKNVSTQDAKVLCQ